MVIEKGVVVVGSLTADVTAVTKKLPKRGETVLGHELTLVSGGKGSNQAVMAARMQVPTWMVGSIGNDQFKTIVLDSLKENEVHTEDVTVFDDEKTGIAHIRVDETGDNDIVIVPQANLRTDKAKVDQFFEKKLPVNVLLLQLEISVDTTAYAAKRGKEEGLTVILDPAPAAELPEELYQYIDYITPNETEASILTGIEVKDFESANQAAQIFLDLGVKNAIITLGEKGVLIKNNEGLLQLPAYKVQAVDTTAAGDAFTGTFGACLSNGFALEEAIKMSSIAGALTVTKLGAQPALPTYEEIKQFAESQVNQTQ
jgi:ribokinase